MVGMIRDAERDLLCNCDCPGYRHCPHCGGCLEHPECAEFDPPTRGTP